MKKIFRSLSLICCAAVALCASAARVDTITVASTLIPQPMKVSVVVPDTQGRDYPTVYLLNGYGGDYTSWLTVRPDLPEMADRYGMVMVMPSGMDSWYWNSPADSTMQMESFITEVLVPRIDTDYPTIRDARQRAITGLSMGGHGAMWLAGRHPELWRNAGATSGGVDIRPFPNRWTMKKWLGPVEEFPERWERMTVAAILPQIKEAGLNIIFDCGVDDFFAEVNDNLHRSMVEKGIPHDYISRPGNHSRDYWNNSIQYQLLFFDNQFKKTSK